jgi:hypothetical protein
MTDPAAEVPPRVALLTLRYRPETVPEGEDGRSPWTKVKWTAGIVVGLLLALVIFDLVAPSKPKVQAFTSPTVSSGAKTATVPPTASTVGPTTTTVPVTLPATTVAPTTDPPTTAPSTANPGDIATYTVAAATGALITYTDPANGVTDQLTSSSWTRTWPVADTPQTGFDVSVIAGDGSSSVSCSITWKGTQVATDAGPGSARCDYDASATGGKGSDNGGFSGSSGSGSGDPYIPAPTGGNRHHVHGCNGHHIHVCP